MEKFEYALDTFKGTCELNNYRPVKIHYSKTLPVQIHDDMIKSEFKKIYYYGITFDKEQNYIFGAIDRNIPDIYSIGEMINMAWKILYHMDIEDIQITVQSSKFPTDELIDNLEALDLVVDASDSKDDKDFSFEICYDSEILVDGGVNGKSTYFEINYSAIEPLIPSKSNEVPLDAYVKPLDENCKNDAFIISANLKDAGFKIDVDYSLNRLDKSTLNSTFLISFDTKDIEKYQVKLIDLATEEVKTVMIDNLIEELAFI